MSGPKAFHLGDVLSVTTGILVSPKGMGGVHELLDFMTGDVLMTHQLPRAVEVCGPELIARHPSLDVATPTAFAGEPDVLAWLDRRVAELGEYLLIWPLAPEEGQWVHMDPLVEWQAMRGDPPIVVVVPGGAS